MNPKCVKLHEAIFAIASRTHCFYYLIRDDHLASAWLERCMYWGSLVIEILYSKTGSSPLKFKRWINGLIVAGLPSKIQQIFSLFLIVATSNIVKDHPFSKYAKFSEKLTFLTTCYAQFFGKFCVRTKWMIPNYSPSFEGFLILGTKWNNFKLKIIVKSTNPTWQARIT